jgi:tRNA (guanosine-2'-O-)-methyltransferase
MYRNMELENDINPESIKELIIHLRQFVTGGRYQKFIENVQFRTRHLTIVLEDIYQPHNASAVLRTCDCFGIQDVHIIENRNTYQVNPDVALGSSQWLDLIKYNGPGGNTVKCLQHLREKGYRIVATTPHKDDYTPDSLPLDQKTALVFGTELEGLTPEALSMADDFIRIPMVGFTESLNISVSAAIIIQSLSNRLRSSGINWQLTPAEQDHILLGWLKQSVKKSEIIIREFTSANR